jgi:regulator of sigma E protease
VTIDLKILRNRIPDTESAELLYLIPEGSRPAVGEVLHHTPAEQSNLKAGDILLQAKDNPLFSRAQAVQIFSSNKGIELPLKVLRGKDTVNLSVIPGGDGKIGAMIGNIFTGPSELKAYGFFTSIYMGYTDIAKMTNLTFNMIGKVFKGQIAFDKAFGGPIKIAQVATSSADRGIGSFLYFLALLSLSLAIINIMPFPVLDGGHLIIIFIEGIMKKEIPIKVKVGIQNAGFVILLLLMAFIIYNDILSL